MTWFRKILKEVRKQPKCHKTTSADERIYLYCHKCDERDGSDTAALHSNFTEEGTVDHAARWRALRIWMAPRGHTTVPTVMRRRDVSNLNGTSVGTVAWCTAPKILSNRYLESTKFVWSLRQLNLSPCITDSFPTFSFFIYNNYIKQSTVKRRCLSVNILFIF
jgi:hypothetical protein